MRILNASSALSIVIAVLISAAVGTGCGTPRPLSPKESFETLRSAYQKKDVDTLLALYSKKTLASYGEAVQLINGMSADQRKKLYETRTIPVEGKISIRDFVRINLDYAAINGGDPVIEGFNQIITSISVSGKKAVIRTDNGIELHFVQEGLFWKFSPEER